MSERYSVLNGSASGHCCFGATVVDTQTPHPAITGKSDWVCECYETWMAQKIADALNAAEPTGEEE